MTPKAVERMLIDDARLLARREDQIDAELEAERQQCLELFYQWQDGLVQFESLVPFAMVLDRKCKKNRNLIRWLHKFSIED